MSKNIYDAIIAIGPPLLVAIVSWISIRWSYRKNKLDKYTDVQTEKIDKFYEKLLNVNSDIKALKETIENIGEITNPTAVLALILKNIEMLKIEGHLYLKIKSIESFKNVSESYIKFLIKCSDSIYYKEVSSDDETENIEDEEIVIVPSTFEQRYCKYIEYYEDLVDKMIIISDDLIGINK